MREWLKAFALVMFLAVLCAVFVGAGTVFAAEKVQEPVQVEPVEQEIDLLWWVRAGEFLKKPVLHRSFDPLWWMRR